MITVCGVGNVFSGESDVIMRPDSASSKIGVIYVHGAEAEVGGGLTWMKISTRAILINAIADAGYTMISADLGGTGTWGNDTAISRITAAKNYLQSMVGVLPGKVILIGQSMGGLNAMVWASKNPNLVQCLIGAIPVVNLTDVYGGGIYTNAINAAYGGTYSEASYGASHNPYTFSGNGSLNQIPMQIWYGDSDTTCLPQYSSSMASRANMCECHSISGGHAESTVAEIDPSVVLSFIKSYGG